MGSSKSTLAGLGRRGSQGTIVWRAAVSAVVDALEQRTLFSTAYGLSNANELLRFNTDLPTVIQSTTQITGLQPAENILAMDFSPVDGRLVGIGTTHHVYTIDLTTGVATSTTQFLFVDPLVGTNFNLDFVPTNPLGTRLVSDANQNMFINADDGGAAVEPDLFFATGDPNDGTDPNVVAGAFTNAVPHSFGTEYYGIDSNLDAVVKLTKPEFGSDGELTTIGNLGVDAGDQIGFDTNANDNIAYASMTVGGITSLYTINLTTGAATSLGLIGTGVVPLRDLAVYSHGVHLTGLHANSLFVNQANQPNGFGSDFPISPSPVGMFYKGIDTRPSTGETYALGMKDNGQGGFAGSLFKVSPGPAVLIGGGPFKTDFASVNGFGFDFDPVTDQIRITTSEDGNFRLNPGTAALSVDTALDDPIGAEQIVALAYDNNVPTAVSSTLYGINAANSSLVRIGGLNGTPSANGGLVTTVGPLGISVTDNVSTNFDISGVDGTALLSMKDPNSSNINLYSVNLATGAATLVGPILNGFGGFQGMSMTIPGRVKFDQPTYTQIEGQPATVITVQRVAGSLVDPFSVDVTISAGSATPAADFIATTKHITFDFAETSKTFIVGVVNDPDTEVDETVNLTLVNPTQGAILDAAQSTAVFTIKDNDDPAFAPTAMADHYSTLQNTDLNVSGPGVLSNDTDPNNDPMTMQFANGAGPLHGTITPHADGGFLYKPVAGYTGPDSFKYRATDGINQSQLTIVDIDVLPPGGNSTVAADDVSITEGNSGVKSLTFTIKRTGDLSTPASVTYSTADLPGQATGNVDYGSVTNTVNFIANQATATVMIPIVGDMTVEPDETFALNLTNGVGTIISDSQAIGTILNDDLPPGMSAVAIDDVSVLEGNSGLTTLTFTLTRTGDLSTPASVLYGTTDVGGNATANSDYGSVSNKIDFAVNQMTATVSVSIVGDKDVEPDETFFMNLAGAVGTALSDAQGSGKIVNDDVAAVSSVAAGDVSITEGNSGIQMLDFTVTRTGDLSTPATVSYATTDVGGTATAGTDYGNVSNTISFIANQMTATVSVPIKGDFDVEGNETFFLNLSNPVGTSIGDAQAVGTINNDDNAAPPANAFIGPDPGQPGKMALIVTGTDAGEFIDFGVNNGSTMTVKSDGVLLGQFSTSLFGRIYIDAKGGDDHIAVTTKTTKDAVILGGEGSDQIKGGYGRDIILGGIGNDILSGRKGRDFMIGGVGADGLAGDEDDDLLIAASTIYDADFTALLAIQKEWLSSNSYSKRVSNIRNGTGSNVGGRKLNDATILEDAAFDQLTGNGSSDVFFYHKKGGPGEVADLLNDKKSDETAVNAN